MAAPRSVTASATTFALCGVVGSGNLEILVRPGDDVGVCDVTVKTSARGFGEIWHAVLAEFAGDNPAGGTRILINDMGATPAVVSLRLGQALMEYLGDSQ
ncbi:MAG: malonate decarboxylase acyl carrier protein [Candidatus Accumulibacter sp.]|uniref:Malonate decarboxylase acyl carrier protein n=1 Tax=Candidatus Accumulibacter affinis TaxID=2954384 RepID=A0A935TBB0_9PROT|nr:malonate decarboxylase acyl carrier protein [Candidatus Accumulibacter affinis]